MPTTSETRRVDAKGRLLLSDRLAGATVVVEQLSETEFRVRKAQVIPEDELPFYEEQLKPLSAKDAAAVLDVLDHPPKPGPVLKRAAKWYKEQYG